MDTIRHLNIELTEHCNQACQYCFNSCSSLGGHNSFNINQWKTILKKLKTFGLESIHITGGEPFTHPQIIMFIHLVYALDIQVSILSNGFNIAKYSKSYGEILEKLHHAQISLDSLDKEYLSKIRGYKNALNDAISAIVSLKHLGVPVEISTVNNGDKNQVDRIIEFAELMECEVLVRQLENQGRAKTKYNSISELQELTNRFSNCDYYLPSERLKGAELGYWTISSKGDFLPRPYISEKIEYETIIEMI